MKKIHVLLDHNSVAKIKKNACETDFILCGKGLAKYVNFCDNKYELKGYSVSKDVKNFSDCFRIELAKLEHNGFIIESQVNDIFKFIFLELLEICEFLSDLNGSEVVLYDGNHRIKFVSVFMASNTEVANPILSSRSRIINPFLHDWLDSAPQFKVSWQTENLIKLTCLKILRNSIIFAISAITGLRSLKLKWGNKPLLTKAAAIYRTKDQLINLQVLKPYYGDELTFIQGPAVGKLDASPANSLVSLSILLKSIFVSLKHHFCNLIIASSSAKIQFLGGEFQIKSSDVANEASLLVTSFVHYFGLKACLTSPDTKFFYTSEMTSRYAVIEKIVLRHIDSSAAFVGLQFISMGNLIVPCFPVQDKLIVKSKNEEISFTANYENSDVKFLGSLSATKFFGGEHLYKRNSCKNVVFFTQPYGVEDNKKIITLILDILPCDWLFIVRRHPRDITRYELISSRIKYDENTHYLETLVEADFVVTKTSSVLSECIDFEKAHVAVLVDTYSQSIIDSIAGEDVNRVFALNDLANFLKKFLSEYKYQREIYAPKKLLLSKIELDKYLEK